MQARYFRYLFENVNNGVVHTGCIWNSETDKKVNFVYLSEGAASAACSTPREKMVRLPEAAEINLLVLGSYSFHYLKKTIELARNHSIKQLVLPYLAPIQRLQLANYFAKTGEGDDEILQFLQEPYQFLQNTKAQSIYFVYGNGAPLREITQDMHSGVVFEMAETYELERIREMEGTYVPVVKAGYMVENQWLFYFACYGTNILEISEFTRSYSESHEHMRNEVECLLEAYRKHFQDTPDAGIIMYHGPLNASPGQVDSMLSAKAFRSEQPCESEISHEKNICMIKCLHRNDYDMLKKHLDKNRENTCYGMLIFGDKEISECFEQIRDRFDVVRENIRGLSMPTLRQGNRCAKELVEWVESEDRTYWICGVDGEASVELMKVMMDRGPCHRFASTNSRYGYCFSGYLVAFKNR